MTHKTSNTVLFYSIAIIIIVFKIKAYGQSPLSAPPTGINYQAIARDSLGHSMSNATNLKVTFSIWDTIVLGTGNMLFTETHDSVSTNKYGLFTLVIGSKNPVIFDTIHWFAGPKFLQIEIDLPGQNTATLERTQFMSVPYALHSKTASRSFENWSLTGNQTDNTHFLGTNNSQDLVFKTNNTERMRIVGVNNATKLLTIPNMSTNGNEIEFLATGTNNADIHANSNLNISSTQNISFITGSSSKMYIDNNNGYIGIGTTSPTASLDISGSIRILGGSPGIGKILTSSTTTGLAFWDNPTWRLSGINFYNTNSGNVGIGIQTPSSKLEVGGTITISGTNNELNRPQTGVANLVPIAYGSVNASGTPSAANTGNFTVNPIDDIDDYYEISIDNEYYTSTGYITMVTPGDDNLKVSAKGVNGKLIVKFFNLTNNGVQSPFQFIVYKP